MTMASFNKNTAGSDDEDDLELLRLQALKSLKPKNTNVIPNKSSETVQAKSHNSFKLSTFGAAQTTRHHNRVFRNNTGRSGRNGMNPRLRTNTNLISIQTIDQNEPKEISDNITIEVPKLVLPQDRYYKTNITDSDVKENVSNNKFDRYDNSEDSESDSDEQVIKPNKRERKNSLEQLMDDLENEINVLDNKSEIKDTETDSELLKMQENESDSEMNEKQEDTTKEMSDTLIIFEPELVQNSEMDLLNETEKPLSPVYRSRSSSPNVPSEKLIHTKRKTRSRSPNPRSLYESQYKSPTYRSPRRSRSPPRKNRYSPNHYSRPLSPLSINADVLNTITMAPLSPRSAAFVLQNRQILARRQMSPRRSLSRESSRSISPPKRTTKLSPRRRSPRFDSSRKCSLSPRKRSNSPRLSPKRKSTSPRNHNLQYRSKHSSNSPLHKRLTSRPSSRNSSPLYDYERKQDAQTKRKRTNRSISLSLSPSPDRNYHKKPLNQTTGYINDASLRRPKSTLRKDSLNPKDKEDKSYKSLDPVLLSPSPDRNYYKKPLNQTTGYINDALRRPKSALLKESPIRKFEENKDKEDKSLDPVLEARRKKFESPVRIGKNAIIKLKTNKPQDDTSEETLNVEKDNEHNIDLMESKENDEILENELEDDDALEENEEEIDDSVIDLNPTIDDLWSDEEESDNENEGRFKTSNSSQKNKNIAVLSFRKLTDHSNPKDSLLTNDYQSIERKYNKRQKNSSRKRSRSRSPKNVNAKRRERDDKLSESKLTKVKSEAAVNKKSVDIDEKKKEKNISAPAAAVYVKSDVSKRADVLKTIQTEKNVRRKVKIQALSGDTKPIVDDRNVENNDETEIIIENDDGGATNKGDDGDLRAELSRRRAQRLIKAGTLAESLPARILKSALQEAVPKRPAIKHSKIQKGSGSAADRRVLILKRLASSPVTQLESADKGKDSGKLPIHMRLGSSNVDLLSEDLVRTERNRSKRGARSNRRKKSTNAVQV